MTTRFERQLEELHVQIITMGSLCEKVIAFSAKAIQGVNCSKEIFDTDREIDAKEREIENICMRLLLHQQPAEPVKTGMYTLRKLESLLLRRRKLPLACFSECLR